MKKILLITPRYPFPVIGGDKLRIYNIAKHLSSFYSLTLLSLYSTQEEEETSPEEGLFERVYKVRQPAYVSYCNAVKNFLGGKSLQTGYFFNRRLYRLVHELAPGHDLIIAHLMRTSEYVRGLNHIPKLCEMTDAISLNYEGISKKGEKSLKEVVFGIEQKRCLKSELDCLRAFDGCVVVSGRDRQYLLKHGPFPEKVHIIPNGVDYERFDYPRRHVRKGKIVFLGNMRTVQNADAASWFAKAVFPAIKRAVSDSSFWVVGAEPTAAVRALGRIPGVIVTGRVADVAECAGDATVSVCPMRIGAGVQNKILESMAMGVPVVASNLAVKGLQVRNVLTADSPEEFKTKILHIHDDGAAAGRLAACARRFVEENFSWQSVLSPYRDLIEGVFRLHRRQG